MLTGVSVSCFLLSYVVVFGMEVARIIFKFPGRNVLLIGMMAAGLFAHTVFLGNEFWQAGSQSSTVLSNWFQWTVLGAWGLAFACLILTVRNPNGSVGLFLVPAILVLIGIATLVRNTEPFPRESAISFWRATHGVSLLVGTMFIALGLSFGVMYLLQSLRLKSKRRLSYKIKLPALEFLRSMNRLSLFATAITLGVGLISGVMLNLNREGEIAWLSGGILFSFALFVFTLVGAIAEMFTRGSLGERRSAYLVIANFLFMLLVFGLLMLSSHGQQAVEDDAAERALETDKTTVTAGEAKS